MSLVKGKEPTAAIRKVRSIDCPNQSLVVTQNCGSRHTWVLFLVMVSAISKDNLVGYRWLIPAILATQEAEIREITDQTILGK
jgi:hypothetical protein